MKKNTFQDKIKPLLQYIGTIGAVLTSIVYVIIVVVMIAGFSFTDGATAYLFPVVNAIIGFVIMQFLKVQGIDFAKGLPENKEVRDRYYNTKTKDKKIRSLRFFWMTSLIKDIIFKCASVAVITSGLIYIVIKGSQDYMLLLMAASNLILFICFGLLALNNAYNFYNEFEVPYMEEKLKEAEQSKSKTNKEVKDK